MAECLQASSGIRLLFEPARPRAIGSHVLVGNQKNHKIPEALYIFIVVPELLQCIAQGRPKNQPKSFVPEKEFLEVIGSERIEIQDARRVIKEDVVAKSDLTAIPAGYQYPLVLETIKHLPCLFSSGAAFDLQAALLDHRLDGRGKAGLPFGPKGGHPMLPVSPEQVCLVSNRAQLFVRRAERNNLGQELRIEGHQSDFT